MQKISKVAGFQPADLFKHNSFTCTSLGKYEL